MMWFDPDDWYWKEITFSDDPTVTWVLDQKLDEKFCQRTQKRSIPPHDPCAAWAVFSCKQKDGQGEKHAMKIWMQIPYTDTEFKPAGSRKAQAQENLASGAKDEIKALGLLGANGSKHSPTLVRVLNAKQDNDGMVPTGFITYILMTWCPGVPLFEKDYYSKPKEERDAIRHAFNEAWNDARRCGVFNRLPSEGDLIWDAANKKCYMVDFKEWSLPRPSDINAKYDAWGLFDY